jgi:hypothetical protein
MALFVKCHRGETKKKKKKKKKKKNDATDEELALLNHQLIK